MGGGKLLMEDTFWIIKVQVSFLALSIISESTIPKKANIPATQIVLYLSNLYCWSSSGLIVLVTSHNLQVAM
jgi:hypothetical protein